MEKLNNEQLLLTGGKNRCGTFGQSMVFKGACALGGGLIGFGLGGGNPATGWMGARLGLAACVAACHV